MIFLIISNFLTHLFDPKGELLLIWAHEVRVNLEVMKMNRWLHTH